MKKKTKKQKTKEKNIVNLGALCQKQTDLWNFGCLVAEIIFNLNLKGIFLYPFRANVGNNEAVKLNFGPNRINNSHLKNVPSSDRVTVRDSQAVVDGVEKFLDWFPSTLPKQNLFSIRDPIIR